MSVLTEKINQWFSDADHDENVKTNREEMFAAFKNKFENESDETYLKFLFVSGINITKEVFNKLIEDGKEDVLAWHVPAGAFTDFVGYDSNSSATTEPATPTPIPATTEPATPTTEPATPTTEPATTEPTTPTTEPATPTTEPELTVSPSNVSIKVGETATLTAQLTTAVGNSYAWNVPDVVTGESSVASITVTGKTAGTGEISVTAANLTATATITVTEDQTVEPNPEQEP